MANSGVAAAAAAAALILVFFTGASATGYTGECGRTCKFQFCGYRDGERRDVFAIDQYRVDAPFTPAICDKAGRIVVGSVDSTGEAYVEAGYGRELISRWAPYGLQQKFSPSFFKSYYLGGVVRSGVGTCGGYRRGSTSTLLRAAPVLTRFVSRVRKPSPGPSPPARQVTRRRSRTSWPT
jgi:hypothetical protein